MTFVRFINSSIENSDINELLIFNNDVEFIARVMEVRFLILFSEIIRC